MPMCLYMPRNLYLCAYACLEASAYVPMRLCLPKNLCLRAYTCLETYAYVRIHA